VIRTVRNILIAAGAFCFLIAATQVISLAHNAEHEHGEGHDHDQANCTVCIAANAIQKQLLAEPEPQLRQPKVFMPNVLRPLNEDTAQFEPRPHCPRAPPALS